MTGKDRLIVALDVSTHDEAIRLVDDLQNVSFFKVGLKLFLAGDLFGLLTRMQERRRDAGGVFIDLKLAGDIGNTITDFFIEAARLGIRFITLVPTDPLAITRHSIAAARKARGTAGYPQVLMVPYFSSMGVEDLRAVGINESVDEYIVNRGLLLRDAGCDGLIVSGTAIGACRTALGPTVPIVSPGIRPAWSTPDDHARLTTPADAIRMGADYLVVGRPVRNPTNRQDRFDAAQRIIDEIDATWATRPSADPGPSAPSRSGSTTPPRTHQPLAARSL